MTTATIPQVRQGMPERGARGSWQYLAFWKNDGQLDLGATLHSLPVSDMKAAYLICGERPRELHHVTESGTWYTWNGRCHAADTQDSAARIIYHLAARAEQLISHCRQLVTAGLSVQDAAEAWRPWEPACKYLTALQRTAGHSALLKALAVTCGTEAAVMDERHPGWLNFANGTVDLRTGLIKPHDPADMITYCLEHSYRPGAACPRFWALGRHVAGGDEGVFRFLMTVLGYSLIGSNPERAVVFINGPTSSGKSVLLDVVRSVLGPLAHQSQAALITLVRNGRNARTMNSIRGMRLVTITETSAFMHIDEGQLKMITGEAHISVDQHYAKTEVRTPVTWLIVVATNQMPSLTDFDAALRERVYVIPGGDTVPPEHRVKDLGEALARDEADGILAGLVWAAMSYYGAGERLVVPHAVAMETARYAAEQNTAGQFLADTTVPAGPRADGTPSSIPQNQLWQEYQRWSRGEVRLGKIALFERIAAMPGVFRNDAMRRFEGRVWTTEVAYRLSNS